MMTDEQRAREYRRVLLMVAELHLRGYQRLRILPYMAPSGMSWRCAIAPAALFSQEGTRLDESGEFGETTVTYSSAAGGEYFLWTDAARATPSSLARLFIERFPKITAAAKGSDWMYAGWYVEMLGLTYPNRLPFAFADWDGPEEPEGDDTRWRTITIGVGERVRIPLPPPNPFATPGHGG